MIVCNIYSQNLSISKRKNIPWYLKYVTNCCLHCFTISHMLFAVLVHPRRLLVFPSPFQCKRHKICTASFESFRSPRPGPMPTCASSSESGNSHPGSARPGPWVRVRCSAPFAGGLGPDLPVRTRITVNHGRPAGPGPPSRTNRRPVLSQGQGTGGRRMRRQHERLLL